MFELEACILIGGKSSRLGTDKAFVGLGGMTLAERALANVRDGLPSAKITIVAGGSTQFAIEAIAIDTPFIFDLYEARGPLGGLHAALAYAKTPWIFVLACDYPFVSPQLISFLAEQVTDEFGSVAPEQNDGRLQPLCALYNVAAARTVVEEILDRPRVAPPMHEVISQLNPRVVGFDEYSHLAGADTFFININTAADLTDARKIARKLSPPD
jgi:molybdopterin-guanine dinucleotide biosynthesis protein A